jgi:hypothetical protein
MIRARRLPEDRVCAVNTQILKAPWADIAYACDWQWWREYGRQIRALKCRKVSVMAKSKPYGADETSKPGAQTGASHKPGTLNLGGNSGYQAINLMYLEGFRVIVVTGLDCAHTFGRRHDHQNHPTGMDNASHVGVWKERFPTLAADLKAAGVRVINASRHTALDCFERMPLSDVFKTRGKP